MAGMSTGRMEARVRQCPSFCPPTPAFLQGNVILTDHKYEVLTLLRSHRDDAAGLIIMARHPYPMAAVRLRRAVRDVEELREALQAGAGEQGATLKCESSSS